MRIEIISKCSFLQRLQLRLVKQYLGFVPGPIQSMTYKRDFFGKYYCQCLEEAMRKAKCWTKGEVELFAAFVSKQNDCAY
jgi:hypothetical protein